MCDSGRLARLVRLVTAGVRPMNCDSFSWLHTQESKAAVESLGDGLREGGEALAKGLFRGVTGVVMKPIEGAQERGVGGFATGLLQGIVGVAAQPVSGALDFVSKAADGANASRLKLTALAPKSSKKRWRLPRAIKGDHVLRPFDLYSAQGQASLCTCFAVNASLLSSQQYCCLL